MAEIRLREVMPSDVGGIQTLEKKLNKQAAPSWDELYSFLSDRNCGGWLAEHQRQVVGCLLYRASWAENCISAWRLTMTGSEREWAVRERLILRLLLLAQNFIGVDVLVAAQAEDLELVQILQSLRFHAAELRDGLLWFRRRSQKLPREETPGGGDRTHFNR